MIVWHPSLQPSEELEILTNQLIEEAQEAKRKEKNQAASYSEGSTESKGNPKRREKKSRQMEQIAEADEEAQVKRKRSWRTSRLA